MASGFTSGITSGTSGTIRNAELLSTTIDPRSTASGPSSLLIDPPALNRAMSIPSKLSGRSSSTVYSRSSNVRRGPAASEQADVPVGEVAVGKDPEELLADGACHAHHRHRGSILPDAHVDGGGDRGIADSASARLGERKREGGGGERGEEVVAFSGGRCLHCGSFGAARAAAQTERWRWR